MTSICIVLLRATSLLFLQSLSWPPDSSVVLHSAPVACCSGRISCPRLPKVGGADGALRGSSVRVNSPGAALREKLELTVKASALQDASNPRRCFLLRRAPSRPSRRVKFKCPAALLTERRSASSERGETQGQCGHHHIIENLFDGSAVEKRSVNPGRRRDNASAFELARRARSTRAARRRGQAPPERPNTPEVVPRPARSYTWRAELRRNFGRASRTRSGSAPRRPARAPSRRQAVVDVRRGLVAFDAGPADATRLESACLAAGSPTRRRGRGCLCVSALERGDAVGAGVQSALNALGPSFISWSGHGRR